MANSVLSRVSNEKEQLDVNLEKLKAFIKSDSFQDEDIVSPAQVKLLVNQKNAMENYSDILSSRIEDLVAENSKSAVEEVDSTEEE